VSEPLRLADLDPRIRLMILLILGNRDQILRPQRGTLELSFHGRHVNAKLIAVEPIGLDGENGGPPPEAA
jgi:hypothetical protein